MSAHVTQFITPPPPPPPSLPCHDAAMSAGCAIQYSLDVMIDGVWMVIGIGVYPACA